MLICQKTRKFIDFQSSFRGSDGIEEILPRVTNTLNLCFNPKALIPEKVTDLTGLSNDLLEFQSGFSSSTGQLLQNFFDFLPKPLILIAHNGNRYDFPLLQAELKRANFDLAKNIFVIDSLLTLKNNFNGPEKPKSFGLSALHETIFGVRPKFSHGAEVDVNALIRVCASKADTFVKYAAKNYDLFCDMKKMW